MKITFVIQIWNFNTPQLVSRKTRNFIATRLGLGINDATDTENHAICLNILEKALIFMGLTLLCFRSRTVGKTCHSKIVCIFPLFWIILLSFRYVLGNHDLRLKRDMGKSRRFKGYITSRFSPYSHVALLNIFLRILSTEILASNCRKKVYSECKPNSKLYWIASVLYTLYFD